jgi:hypothetical protein
MATIKELKTEISQFLFPNITHYTFQEETAFKINDIWIDKIPDNYFFNETFLLIQKIDNTTLKSSEPILIIDEVYAIFEERLKELKSWKEHKFLDYLKIFHNYASDDNLNGLSKETFDKEVLKKITKERLNNAKECHPLFKLRSFVNMVSEEGVNKNEYFEFVKVLYHINEIIVNLEMVKTLLLEIISDNKKYKIVQFDDYFKSFYAVHVNKIKVDLQLKELAYFYWFVEQSNLFSMHHDKNKNRKMLQDFFEKYLMYTDAKGNPKHFKRFIKEISDVKFDESKSRENFANNLISKLEQFKVIELFKVGRSVEQKFT